MDFFAVETEGQTMVVLELTNHTNLNSAFESYGECVTHLDVTKCKYTLEDASKLDQFPKLTKVIGLESCLCLQTQK